MINLQGVVYRVQVRLQSFAHLKTTYGLQAKENQKSNASQFKLIGIFACHTRPIAGFSMNINVSKRVIKPTRWYISPEPSQRQRPTFPPNFKMRAEKALNGNHSSAFLSVYYAYLYTYLLHCYPLSFKMDDDYT